MQALSRFVERRLENAKSACGVERHKVRGWPARHHHMALVLIAHLFLAKERLALRDTHRLLSCLDTVEMLRQRLPDETHSDNDLLMSVAQRHRRRFEAAKHGIIGSAYNPRRQGSIDLIRHARDTRPMQTDFCRFL